MPINVISERDALKKLWTYLDSHEWWTIPWVSAAASDLCIEIEGSHYDGAASDGFQVMTLPPASGAFAIAFARKRNLSAHALARLMRDTCAANVTARDLRARDVIIAFGPHEEQSCLHRLTLWGSWVQAGRPDPARRHTPLATGRRR